MQIIDSSKIQWYAYSRNPVTIFVSIRAHAVVGKASVATLG